tara:strand:+ start:730 stop:1788 length:1059 start_codon:yes stop_codon:yes gene_type:complete
MTISTGSGDYVALMGAILTHAITDGWTTTGGTWPINKGVVRGVDWTTFTQSENDFTLLGGATKTARYVRIGIGTSPANATANAALGTAAHCPNMEYTFTSWTIYSDPTLCDYIHVVVNFSNGVNGDCYMHFGFGEIDKKGMAHTGTVYATCHAKRAYAETTDSGNSASDWNGGLYGSTEHGFTGALRYNFSDLNYTNSTCFMVDSTITPLFVGWPATDTVLDPHDFMDTLSIHNSSVVSQDASGNRIASSSWGPSTHACFMTPQPYSGAVTLGPLGCWIHQNQGSSGLIMYLGDFPNIRTCSLRTFSPGDTVTYSSDDWNLWPMLRQGDETDLHTSNHVGSGQAGFAHKRVV